MRVSDEQAVKHTHIHNKVRHLIFIRKETIMIEFKGYLTGTSQKYFCNQIVKFQRLFIMFTCIPGFSIIYLFTYLYWGYNVEPKIIIISFIKIIIISLILLAIIYMLPRIQTKKEKEKITPRRVFIENDIIICQSNALVESRTIQDVKEVRDYGDFYYLVFPFGKYSYRFVCQKNLLTSGTIADFETLFAGKIKRMPQKK